MPEGRQRSVALAESDTSLAIEGQPLVTKWKRGDVQFIGRGVKHESKNPTGKPIDLIIVGIESAVSRAGGCPYRHGSIGTSRLTRRPWPDAVSPRAADQAGVSYIPACGARRLSETCGPWPGRSGSCPSLSA